jgi:hypothetical protein
MPVSSECCGSGRGVAKLEPPTSFLARTQANGKDSRDERSGAGTLPIRGIRDQTLAMKISGHKTDSIFRRYNVTSEEDVVEAMRRVEKARRSLAP